jgi:hypothetical protein
VRRDEKVKAALRERGLTMKDYGAVSAQLASLGELDAQRL